MSNEHLSKRFKQILNLKTVWLLLLHFCLAYEKVQFWFETDAISKGRIYDFSNFFHK